LEEEENNVILRNCQPTECQPSSVDKCHRMRMVKWRFQFKVLQVHINFRWTILEMSHYRFIIRIFKD